MTIHALPTVTDTLDCKVGGCPREARSSRGRYAYLCDEHIETARRDAQDTRAAAAAIQGAIADPALAPPPTVSLAEIADRVPAAARRLEERLLHRRVARDEAQDAIRTLNEILRDLRDAVQELA